MKQNVKVLLIIVVFVLMLAGLSKLFNKSGATCDTCEMIPHASSTKASIMRKTGANIPRLVDLGSTSCIPCRMMTSVLSDLKREYKGKLSVEFIDIGKDRDAARSYKIRAIPTQVFLDASGKEVFRHEGYYPKEDVVTAFKEHGIDLGKGK